MPQTHWPGLWRKDNNNWEIFVEFQVSILLTKIFCWMVTCTLPASINCVYSFNEFMCLWCGLKVKLIPDAGERTHYYRDHKILWTIYYQNCSWVKISWWLWWWFRLVKWSCYYIYFFSSVSFILDFATVFEF